MEHYTKLEGKLEYCDLRESQDTLASKTLWSEFEPRFVNRETMYGKFSELSIRKTT
jgi:hypothetical protein